MINSCVRGFRKIAHYSNNYFLKDSINSKVNSTGHANNVFVKYPLIPTVWKF